MHEIDLPVPLCTKTLVKTPTKKEFPIKVKNSEYYHLGIQKMLLMRNEAHLRDINEVVLQINSDGITMYKSSGKELWLITEDLWETED